MRVAIMGNSGSGKSTLARHLSATQALPLLELDAIVWQPGNTAIQRNKAAIEADLVGFLEKNASWVIEGCYGELIAAALAYEPELVFLNPGKDVCLGNNRRRPWEPGKYESKEAQDAMLASLAVWVEGYYERSDEWSLSAHRRLFDGYSGRKREIRSLSGLAQLGHYEPRA